MSELKWNSICGRRRLLVQFLPSPPRPGPSKNNSVYCLLWTGTFPIRNRPESPGDSIRAHARKQNAHDPVYNVYILWFRVFRVHKCVLYFKRSARVDRLNVTYAGHRVFDRLTHAHTDFAVVSRREISPRNSVRSRDDTSNTAMITWLFRVYGKRWVVKKKKKNLRYECLRSARPYYTVWCTPHDDGRGVILYYALSSTCCAPRII